MLRSWRRCNRRLRRTWGAGGPQGGDSLNSVGSLSGPRSAGDFHHPKRKLSSPEEEESTAARRKYPEELREWSSKMALDARRVRIALRFEVGQRVGGLAHLGQKFAVGGCTAIAYRSASQRIATRPPLPASTWRSTQL